VAQAHTSKWSIGSPQRWFLLLVALLLSALAGCGPEPKGQEEELGAQVDRALCQLNSLDDRAYRQGLAELKSIGAPAVPHLIRAYKDDRMSNIGFECEVGDIADRSAIPDLVKLADEAADVPVTPESIFRDSSLRRKALAARAAIARILGAAKTFPGGIAMTTAPEDSEHYRVVFQSKTKPYYEAVEAWYHAWRKTYDSADYADME